MKLGDKIIKAVRWIEVQEGPRGRITTKLRGEAVGTVVYIHPKGRYYTLEFTFPDGTFRESFRCLKSNGHKKAANPRRRKP